MCKLNSSKVRNVKVVEVIEVVSVIGQGTEENMARYLREYYTFDGKLLAIHDTLQDVKKEN